MFTFQTLWTPRVIHVIYIVGLVLIVLSGFGALFYANYAMSAYGQGGGGFMGTLWVLIFTLVSVVLWRVWCEIVLVLFKLHDRLVEVRDAVKH